MKNDDIIAQAKALNEQLEASTTENSQLKARITGLSKMDLSEVASQTSDFKNSKYLGTHKFEEPVSNTTLKLCGGVPIVIGP